MTTARPIAGIGHLATLTALLSIVTNPLQANPETGNFSFPTNTRIGAQAGYFRHFVPSEGWLTRMNWTGSLATCNPGTLSADYYNDSLRRINYYRAQAGLPTDITHNATKSAKCEWATLIFSSQNNISHFPATDFPANACLTADKAAHGGNGWGHEAAGKGNLSLGSAGPDSLAALILDSGAGNTAVGHRRWFLYPLQQEMGFGGVPKASNPAASACVWVIGDFKAPSPASVKLVTWPNAGFIPYDHIPTSVNTAPFGGQMRWSCGYTNGDFTSATVSMSRTSGAGAPANISVTKESYQTNFGDNTIVWLINGGTSIIAPTSTQDISYSVTISGITLTTGSPPPEFTATGGGTYRYTYTVTTFDPNSLSAVMTVTGTSSPAMGLPNTYAVNQLPESSGLRFRVGTTSSTAWTEGAEDAPTPKILDGTTTGYALRTVGTTGLTPATGAKIFHLAFGSSPAVTQSFSVDRFVLPSTTSRLQFKHRFRFLTTSGSLNAEISTDGGTNWTKFWSRPGDANSSSGSSATWETVWQNGDVAIPATHVGKVCQLRFTLTNSGSFNQGTSLNYGAFVDDVTLTAAQEYTTLSTTELPGTVTTCNFTPPTVGTYLLQSQMELGDSRWFDFGTTTTVTAVAPTAIQTWRSTNLGTATNSGTAADAADADGDGLANVIEYAFGLNPLAAQTTSPDLPKLTKSGSNLVFTFKPAATAAGLSYTVQQSPTMATGTWTPVTTFNAGGLYSASVPIGPSRVFMRLVVNNNSGL